HQPGLSPRPTRHWLADDAGESDGRRIRRGRQGHDESLMPETSLHTPGSFIAHNVSLLEDDGNFGAARDVAVENGIIVEVGARLRRRDWIVLDLRDLWLMPGVFDCHLHLACSTLDELERMRTPLTQWCLESAQNFSKTLDSGVTFVRDAAGAD